MLRISSVMGLVVAVSCAAAWAATAPVYDKPAPTTKAFATKVVIPAAPAPVMKDGVLPFVHQQDAPYMVVTRPIPGSRKTYDLYLVQTRDEIIVPMAVRKPPGDGPFPAVLIGIEAGGGGFVELDKRMHDLEPTMDELTRRGYVVAYGNTRTMVAGGFNRGEERAHRVPDTMNGGRQVINSAPALDSDDFVSFIQQLKALPFIKADQVCSVGVGRSGELAVEAATVLSWAAAVNSEGSNWEVLKLDLAKAPRANGMIKLPEKDIELAKQLADKDAAIARFKKIKTPMINMSRPPDQMSGLARLAFEWQKEAGVDAQFGGFNSQRHGYIFPLRTADNKFVDHLELQALWDWLGELDKRLGRSEVEN